MKVGLILDQQASEQAVVGADAYWIVASPQNRALAERIRAEGSFDPNSAVFTSDPALSLEDVAAGVLDNIDEYHPDWTQIEVIGAGLAPTLLSKLHRCGNAAATTPQGFVITRG